MAKKNALTVLIASLIVGLVAYYLFQSKNSSLVSYGYGFKNEKYISRKVGDVQDFGLLDHLGTYHSLYRDSNAKAIVIISQGNDCPIIQKYSLIINELKNKFGPQNIIFYMLNSARNDSREAIIAEAKKYNFDLPILMDPSQLIAESLGITRTSEAVIITPEDWRIVYRGAISDRMDYGVDKQTARNNYVDDVLTAVIENKKISQDKPSPAKGCLISFVKPKSISYEKVIAPIMISKCLTCHSEAGGYLPHFTSYEKLKNWVAMSRETIFTERMPPWSADPLFGSYKNNLSLTPEEKRTLVKWIDSGAERDGGVDPLLNGQQAIQAQKDYFKKFRPLYTAEMKEVNVIPAGGLIEYKYIQVGNEIPFDMWVTGVETISSNSQLLHHANLMIASKPLKFYEDLIDKSKVVNRPEIEKNTDGDFPIYTLAAFNSYEEKHSPDTLSRFLIFAPGRPQPLFFGTYGHIFFPKGSYLIEEAHYMGTGKIDNEINSIRLYGYREKIKDSKLIKSLSINNYTFTIEPYSRNTVVVTPEYKIDKNIQLISFNGHLHMRGVSMKLEVKDKNNNFKTLLSIPNYYYGWGTGTYLVPEKPISINAGSSLRAICVYDNSEQNPYNPDPSKKINFGQRVDRAEMCQLNIGATFDDPNEKGFIHSGYDIGSPSSI